MTNDTQEVSVLVTQAAKILRTSLRNVQRIRERGLIGCLPGRPVRIPTDEILNYIARQTRRNPTPAELAAKRAGQCSESG